MAGSRTHPAARRAGRGSRGLESRPRETIHGWNAAAVNQPPWEVSMARRIVGWIFIALGAAGRPTVCSTCRPQYLGHCSFWSSVGGYSNGRTLMFRRVAGWFLLAYGAHDGAFLL